MAGDKKGFILYADLIHTVNQLPNDKAGKLFKHILSYVNDKNPQSKDIIINVAFEPIKQQLKRDLKKYEGKKLQWSDAGKASAEARKQRKKETNERSTDSTNVKDRSTDSTVNVNDTVNDTVNVIDNDKKEIFSKWLDYRKQIKKAIKVKLTLNSLVEKVNTEPLEKVEWVINSSIENGYQGLFWDNYEQRKIKEKGSAQKEIKSDIQESIEQAERLFGNNTKGNE